MSLSLEFQNPGASLIFPQGKDFESTTHLAIGAHSDDLEIMAYHGIATCYENQTDFFSGITVTNGAGSPQNEKAKLEAQALVKVRQSEQVAAAEMGRYGFIAQLDYKSSEVAGDKKSEASDEILKLLTLSKPEVVYLHQPGDKHPTHLAVLRASIEALQKMPPGDLPKKAYGCEVWRDLDWLSDHKKIYLPTDAYPELALNIILQFQSQINAGVAYDRGTIGRRLANATFADPHVVKTGKSFTLAMDLMPVVQGTTTLQGLIDSEIRHFRDNVRSLWDGSLEKLFTKKQFN